MHELKQRLIHLHSCRNISWKLLYRILKDDQTLLKIYTLSQHELAETFHLSSNQARNLHYDLRQFTPEQVYRYYMNRSITPVTIIDSFYPPLLKTIYDPPFVIYTLGVTKMLKEQMLLSVVGTRQPTEAGKKSLGHLLPPLIQEGWTIVSGLAAGIDALAHEITINQAGQTIAVLGAGFDFMYPKTNKKIFTEMSKSQLLISEYPPYVPPRKWHFPARNRIISGLSNGTLVVEAKDRSGSLITADQAIEQGRDVFAVPGTILSPESIGTNKLIQQGAKLVLTAEDILNEITVFP